MNNTLEFKCTKIDFLMYLLGSCEVIYVRNEEKVEIGDYVRLTEVNDYYDGLTERHLWYKIIKIEKNKMLPFACRWKMLRMEKLVISPIFGNELNKFLN